MAVITAIALSFSLFCLHKVLNDVFALYTCGDSLELSGLILFCLKNIKHEYALLNSLHQFAKQGCHV